ncbi:hypothetical protein ANRL4_04684 [Anaerolineae bacterium]|nr:hypothetical protein ANRL4_04684 [Anaerolineae bacterium]
MATIEQEILDQIRKLDLEQQRQVLGFVRGFTRPKGVLVREFLEQTRDIQVSPEDLEIMKRVAEVDEERIEWDDWNNTPASNYSAVGFSDQRMTSPTGMTTGSILPAGS